MPVIPGFFNRYDEIINCSSDFTRLLMMNEYNDIIVKNRLAGFSAAIPPDSIKFFYDRIINMSSNVHNYLLNICKNTHDETNIHPNVHSMLYLFSKNTLFFDLIIRGKSAFDTQYRYLDEQIAQDLGGGLGMITAIMANQTLYDLPNIFDAEYDVKWWSRGYTGKMSFLGALTPRNQSSGEKLMGYYDFPGSIAKNTIKKGDKIFNRAPLLTYASPEQAMEFGIRQALSHPGADLPQLDIFKDYFARRIIFEIDFFTARNIALWTNPGSPEIIYPADNCFEVTEIEECIAQGQTLALVVRLRQVDNTWPTGQPRRDMLTGEFYDNPLPLHVSSDGLLAARGSLTEMTPLQSMVIQMAEEQKT